MWKCLVFKISDDYVITFATKTRKTNLIWAFLFIYVLNSIFKRQRSGKVLCTTVLISNETIKCFFELLSTCTYKRNGRTMRMKTEKGSWNLGRLSWNPELNLAFKWWYPLNVYRIMTMFSYEFNLDIRYYKYSVIPTLAVGRLHFQCIAANSVVAVGWAILFHMLNRGNQNLLGKDYRN